MAIDATQIQSERPDVRPPRVKRGAHVFVTLTLLGLVFAINRSSFSDSIAHLRSFQLPFLFIALALVALDFTISGLRTYIFGRTLEPDAPFMGYVHAGMANIFMGGVTPSQSGGGPAQIYVLYRNGLRPVDATVVAFLGGFLGTVICLVLFAVGVSLFARPEIRHAGWQAVGTASIMVFVSILLATILSLVYPQRFERVLKFLARLIPPLHRWLQRRGLIDAITGAVARYHGVMTHFLMRRKLLFGASVVLSGLIYFNKFVIGYVVIRGLGLDVPFWPVIGAQFALITIFYFAPTPGASGVAELSTMGMMSSFLPVAYIGVFVLLWRFFTLFLGMIAGAVVMSRYLGAGRRRTAPTAPQGPRGAP